MLLSKRALGATFRADNLSVGNVTDWFEIKGFLDPVRAPWKLQSGAAALTRCDEPRPAVVAVDAPAALRLSHAFNIGNSNGVLVVTFPAVLPTSGTTELIRAQGATLTFTLSIHWTPVWNVTDPNQRTYLKIQYGTFSMKTYFPQEYLGGKVRSLQWRVCPLVTEVGLMMDHYSGSSQPALSQEHTHNEATVDVTVGSGMHLHMLYTGTPANTETWELFSSTLWSYWSVPVHAYRVRVTATSCVSLADCVRLDRMTVYDAGGVALAVLGGECAPLDYLHDWTGLLAADGTYASHALPVSAGAGYVELHVERRAIARVLLEPSTASVHGKRLDILDGTGAVLFQCDLSTVDIAVTM